MHAETPPANPTPPTHPVPRNLPPGLSAPTVRDGCGAAGLQHLVGGPLPAGFDVPGPVRIYGEGDAVTMDFNETRLNVLLDGATRSRILAVTCG